MNNDVLDDKEKIIQDLKAIIKKDNIILDLYERWMKLESAEKGVFKFLLDNDFRKVAVYGMGTLGRSLCVKLEANNVNISYVIEENFERRNGKYLFYTLQDKLPDVDVIIITAVTFYNEIAEVLGKKIKCPLLSLDDIIP